MKKKILATLLCASMAVATLSGCGAGAQTEDTSSDAATETEAEADATETTDGSDLSGTISLAGSTSMEKLCEAMSESFMEAYPGITVTAEYTGSGAGLESLASGSVDIGNASRALKDEETANGAVENIVALDGIAVITDTANTATALTTEQLVSIYKGEITNWSELGGADEAIVVIGREAGSGTRDAFEELLEIADQCAYAQELDSTGGVVAKVAATPGAIGYVSLDAVDDTISTITLDGVEPTEENILSGDYTLQRPFVMATNGEVSEQNELVQTWFDYINSDAGQEVIKSVGLIVPNN